MTRFKMVKQAKGVWDLVKAKDGPWMLFDDHEKVVAEQRQEIARYIDLIAQMGMTEINLVEENKRLAADLAYAGDRIEQLVKEHP